MTGFWKISLKKPMVLYDFRPFIYCCQKSKKCTIGILLALIIPMRILLISEDNSLKTIVTKFGDNSDISVIIHDDDSNPIKVLSNYLSLQPSVIIIDDDYLAPNTVPILESMRKVNKKTKIIFATSDSSIELGKKVSQLGIYFYAIKPVDENEFRELLDSILKAKSQQYYEP